MREHSELSENARGLFFRNKYNYPTIIALRKILQNGSDFRFEGQADISKHGKEKATNQPFTYPDRPSPRHAYSLINTSVLKKNEKFLFVKYQVFTTEKQLKKGLKRQDSIPKSQKILLM